MSHTYTTTDTNPAENRTEADAIIDGAATPEIIDGPAIENGVTKTVVALPDGWKLGEHAVRTGPSRMAARYKLMTASGFAAEMTRLTGERTPLVQLTDRGTLLAGRPDPTSIDDPTYDEVTVMLDPGVSAELEEWIHAGSRGMTLPQWENFVADHAQEIDAADGPDAATVLSDAQNWTTEVRVLRRRVKEAEQAETDEGEQVIARATNKVLQSFKVRVPVLEYGVPYDVLVRIDRDVQGGTIKPTVVGSAALLRDAKRAECRTALDILGIDAIA